ncbi:Elongator complex protein 5 [Aphelenchoides besseyi]|nr:Elongator complex protein 5 [Aphelenchoides besseyi]
MENLPVRDVTLIQEPTVDLNGTPVVLATLKRLQVNSFRFLWLVLLRIHESYNDGFNEHRLDKTAQILHRLSTLRPVITRLFERSSQEIGRLHFVCSNVLRLRVENGKTICETKTEKKDGAYGQTVEEFTVDPTTLSIHAQAYQPPKLQIEEPQANGPQDSLPKRTFDMGLNLSAEEQKAKRSTKLPFTHAQKEEGLVSLNIGAGKKIRAGGQIIYTPDQGDNLDDSDPDEDLMI